MSVPPSPSAPGWVILKFGGTSVSRKQRWQNIAGLMRERMDAGHPTLVVVSALSGVTDALKGIAAVHADPAACARDMEALIARHLGFATELGLPHELLLARIQTLRNLLADHRACAGGYDWQAELLAQGELLSSTLGAHYLRALGVPLQWLDARDYLCSREAANQNQWSRYMSAQCEPRPSLALRAQLEQGSRAYITQGFIARHPGGHTVLLGRGGSDTSASYFGALLAAARVEIWTDVPGMFSANPKLVPDARLLRRLDYDEAQEIATTGAKVLHPRAIAPVREARVPLWIKDTERPNLPGTEIVAEAPTGAANVKAVSLRSNITLVSMESIGMWQQVGFLADIFAIFKRHGLSVDLIGSAETNVTVSLDPSENLLDSNALEALCADLAQVCRVKVIAPCAAVTLVGRGMRSMMHRLSDILADIGQRNVHLVSQSSNNLNLTFVIDELTADGVVAALHRLLVGERLIGVSGDPVFGPAWNALQQPDRIDPPRWWERWTQQLIAQANQASPCYVYSASVLRARAGDLLGLSAVDRRYYAIKANPHPALLRELAHLGFGMECVSAGEIDHVRQVLPDLAPERLLFTPNFAPRTEYAKALQLGLRLTVDNLAILEDWPELFAGREILLRFDLGRGLGHHDKVKTGGEASKFGIGLADIERAQQAVQRCGAQVYGLHAHLGSGILDVAHWRGVYADLASIAERFASVQVLDIGGGLGVPEAAGDPTLSMVALDAALGEVKALYPRYRLWIEPGRFLVAECGVLLARVTQTKHKGASDFLGLDAGMHTLLRPALYDAWHDIVNLSRRDQANDTLCQVVGPICESGDTLGRDRYLPRSEVGDVMLIATAGAYGAAMASNYNLRGLPLEVYREDL